MRRSPLVSASLLLPLALACKQGGSSGDNRDPAAPPPDVGGTGTGQVQIEADPNAGGDPKPTSSPGLKPPKDGAEPSLVVAGQVAVETGLRLADEGAKEMVAFEVSGSSFFSSSAASVLRFPVAADGKFAAALPKKKDDHFYDQFFRPDGSVDVAKARDTLPEQDTAGKSDAGVARAVREGRDYYGNLGYVLASVTTAAPTDQNDWISRLAARKLEAESMQFVALDAANDASFLGLPVQKAKVEDLAVGSLAPTGDEAKSEVAVSETQFDVPQVALDQFATSSDGFKRIKNAYLNVDPVDKREFNVSQIYSWNDIEYHDELDGDGYTKAVLVELPPAGKYSGFTIRFETNRVDDIPLAKACADGGVRLYPPADPDVPFVELAKNGSADDAAGCPGDLTTDEDKSRFFCATNPLSNKNVEAISGSRCQSNSDNDNTPISYGYTADVEDRGEFQWLRMNWGGDSGILGEVPKGLWRFEVDGVGSSPIVAWYDLEKGFPLAVDGKPTLYAPRLKVTRDGGKKITQIDLVFELWNRATSAYEPAKFGAVSRVLARPPGVCLTDFTPPTGQENAYCPEMEQVFADGVAEADQAAHWRVPAALFEGRDWRLGFDADPDTVAAYWDIDNFAINYEAYGTGYRHVIRDYDQW